MTKTKGDYVIGYGKPPAHSRFQPGQSGNPNGRTKGMPNLRTDLVEELGERIRVREGDRERSIPKQRAMLKALMAKALKGDVRAVALLITLVDKHITPEITQTDSKPLSQTEEAILDEFLQMHGVTTILDKETGHD